MARLPYPDPNELPEPAREALERVPPLNIFRMLAHAETAFRPYLRFGGALLADVALDPVARELVILRTARLIEAEYEWIQHVAIGRAVGVTDEMIAALEADDLDADAFDDGQRALLRFVSSSVRSPRPPDDEFAALREHYSPREIVESLLLAGSYTMLGRLMTALDLDLDGPLGTDVVDSASRGRRGSAS